MKELTIGQKAQRYDEAIKVAKSKIKNDKDHVLYEEDIRDIFPELSESEDEKIKKTLIKHFSQVGSLNNILYQDILAWLEKQSDSDVKDYNNIDPHFGKPVDKDEPKFHEGDIIIHKELGGDYIHNPHKIIQVDILDKKYRLEGGLVAHFGEQEDYELVERKPAEWSEEDEKMIWAIPLIINTYPKQEMFYGYNKEQLISWLKSLKDRYTWKPSDKQLKALNTMNVTGCITEVGQGKSLVELYNDLKKLREEYV